MGKEIYYIVQLSPTHFLHKTATGYAHGFGRNGAHRFAAIFEAGREAQKRKDKGDGAKRFPRVLKVTIEIKSINHI